MNGGDDVLMFHVEHFPMILFDHIFRICGERGLEPRCI